MTAMCLGANAAFTPKNIGEIDFMSDYDPETVFQGHRDRFIKVLEPLFLPDDPVSNDIIRYFASLLRVLGMEDKGWDPMQKAVTY